MRKALLLSPSLLGMAVSLSGLMQPPGGRPQTAGPLLSPDEMKAIRGGTQGGVCQVAICRRPDGQLLCTALNPGSVSHNYNIGLDCDGGSGNCTATPNVWCRIDHYYHDNSCTDWWFDSTTYHDKCS